MKNDDYDINEYIIDAAAMASLKTIKYLVNEIGADVNANIKNGYYNTLSIALYNNRDEIVEYLINETSINIHTKHNYVLELAVEMQKMSIIALLLENNAGCNKNCDCNNGTIKYRIKPYSYSIFNWMIKNGRLKALIRLFTEVNLYTVKDILNNASVCNQLEIIQYFLKTYCKGNIHVYDDIILTISNQLDIIKYVIENTICINIKSYNKALEYASKNKHSNVIEYLTSEICIKHIGNMEIKNNETSDNGGEDIPYWCEQKLKISKYHNDNIERFIKSACEQNQLDVLTYITEHNTNYISEDFFKKKINEIFIIIIEKAYFDIIKYLVSKTNINIDGNWTARPIFIAAKIGRIDILDFLIENGAKLQFEPHDDDILRSASRGGHIEMVKYLIESKGIKINKSNGEFPMINAAMNGHLEIVKYLEECGSDIHTRGEDPFKYAAQNGHLAVAEYIFQKGNIKICHINYALRESVEHKQLKVVEFLLETCGAEINSFLASMQLYNMKYEYDRESRPAYIAVKNKHSEMLELLISKGADIHFDNDWLLRLATISYYNDDIGYKIIEILLKHHANINAGDKDSAIAIARKNRDTKTIKLLQSYETTISI